MALLKPRPLCAADPPVGVPRRNTKPERRSAALQEGGLPPRCGRASTSPAFSLRQSYSPLLICKGVKVRFESCKREGEQTRVSFLNETTRKNLLSLPRHVSSGTCDWRARWIPLNQSRKRFPDRISLTNSWWMARPFLALKYCLQHLFMVLIFIQM